jgi:ABC-type multidrug transport system fused ATPase/permease subunit
LLHPIQTEAIKHVVQRTELLTSLPYVATSSSFVPIPTEIAAERRIYLALAAVLVLAAVGAAWLRRRLVSSMSARQPSYGFIGVAAVLVAVLAAVLAAVTTARSHTYPSSEQLWRGVQLISQTSRQDQSEGERVLTQGLAHRRVPS